MTLTLSFLNIIEGRKLKFSNERLTIYVYDEGRRQKHPEWELLKQLTECLSLNAKK